MVDDQQANIDTVNDTPEAAMPTAEQKTNEPDIADTGAQTEVTDQRDTDTLPESAKDRTKQEFERLRQNLREERARREYLEATFNSRQAQPKVEPTPIYDPESGLLNEGALTDVQRRAMEAEERARRAEETIQSYVQEQENRATFAEHPELDPNGKQFDRQLHNMTRSIALDSMLNPQDYGNKQLSFKEAAEVAKKLSRPMVEQARKQGAQEALEQLTPKEQASLEATGSPARRSQVNSNIDDLRRGTRKGDEDAIIERMKRLEPK